MKNFDLNRIHKLAGLLKEEKQPINELNVDNLKKALEKFDIGHLYAMHGAKSSYDDKVIQTYGKEKVDIAIKYAPKYNQYLDEVDKTMKKLGKNPMLLIVKQVLGARDGLSGGYGRADMGSFFTRYIKYK